MTNTKKRKSDGGNPSSGETIYDSKESALEAIRKLADSFDISEEDIALLFSANGRRSKRSRRCNCPMKKEDQPESDPWNELEKENKILRVGDIPVIKQPTTSLPHGMQKDIASNALSWISVLPEPALVEDSETVLALLHAWLIPLSAFFCGRITRTTEVCFRANEETLLTDTEMYLIVNGSQKSKLLFVTVRNPMDVPMNILGRALLKLQSAYKSNGEAGFSNPVHVLITDMRTYQFFAFNGNRFIRSGINLLNFETSRSAFLVDMALLSERLFNVLLCGMISFLDAERINPDKSHVLAYTQHAYQHGQGAKSYLEKHTRKQIETRTLNRLRIESMFPETFRSSLSRALGNISQYFSTDMNDAAVSKDLKAFLDAFLEEK
ncbi:hypothetical protein SCHPADRAFT_1000953 [Schizopora paradoxa]|uniref:Uncharacterized protein n=1 Tax=Schizopora paradoxa TaxID=27342 RepID=A0A0H2RAN6_9AGAM|nr:hypothetical protein SCHPADRAFT_1000953 [Schizopora paradoxa]